MSSETFIELPRKTSDRRWWIKFDKSAGRIISISAKRLLALSENEEVVNTKNTICKEIIHGRKNINNYSMHWDESINSWDIDVKSNVLEIKTKTNKLVPIRNSATPINSDVYIRLYKSEKIIDVKLNLSNIRRTLNLGEIAFIKSADQNLLDIFITKKNDPDYLISTIKIDPDEIFKDGRVTLSLAGSSFTDIIDWENISLYTKPVFDVYGLEIQDNLIVSSELLDKKTLYQVSTTGNNAAHINMYVVNDMLKISSTIEEHMLYCFEGKSKIVFHVSDSEVDNYVTTLTLDTKKLINNTIEVELPKQWPDQPLFTYRNKYVSVNYHGEHNV